MLLILVEAINVLDGLNLSLGLSESSTPLVALSSIHPWTVSCGWVNNDVLLRKAILLNIRIGRKRISQPFFPVNLQAL